MKHRCNPVCIMSLHNINTSRLVLPDPKIIYTNMKAVKLPDLVAVCLNRIHQLLKGIL